jgi:gas vesicle protein
MSSGKVLLSILAGVAVGAVLGVLFAPDKGWNTRKRIAKKGEDHAEDLREKFEEFLDSISEKVDEVKEDVADISEKNKSKGSESKKEAKTGTV